MDAEAARRARAIALQNALEHGGATRPGVILSKLLGEMPQLRPRAGELAAELGPVADAVNALSQSAQRAELESEHPGRLGPARREGRREGELPPLEGAIRGKVVTRFPPEPSGYPHIGHAKAAVINEEYARMYDGSCILRLDDTNPESERLEYYAAIKVGLEWLGIKYDSVKNTSDDMEEILARGEALLGAGGAYVCTCGRDQISAGRRAMESCACSRMGEDKHAGRWEKMFSKYDPGRAIVRFRGDMSSPNTAMRDPTLFRIIDARHPLVGDRYRVWPSYDFAVAVEDSLDGVTHAFRSKEYELRGELYASLLDAMGMRRPQMGVFSRLDFEGMPVSKRALRPLIESGAVSWYDDPRLPTLEAMRRRGIRPDAIREFVLSLGFTKSDTLAPFATLESRNRRAADATSARIHMITDARRLRVDGIPSQSAVLRNHPTAELGERTVGLGGGSLMISGADADAEAVWLIGIGNIALEQDGGALRGRYLDDDLGSGNAKIQWVPEAGSREITIIEPGPLFRDGAYDPDSLVERAALAEPHWASVAEGELVQFVRYGYARKDSQAQAIFTHK